MRPLIFFILLSAKSFSQCEQIEYKKDKFTDVEVWKTPLYLEKKKQKVDKNVLVINNKAVSPIMLFYTSDKKRYVISATLFGERSSFAPKGLYIVFQNGEKLQYPEMEIVEDRLTYSISYFTSTDVDEDEIKTLTSSPITDIRMGTVDTVVDPWLGEKMLENFKCLYSAKKL